MTIYDITIQNYNIDNEQEYSITIHDICNIVLQ